MTPEFGLGETPTVPIELRPGRLARRYQSGYVTVLSGQIYPGSECELTTALHQRVLRGLKRL